MLTTIITAALVAAAPAPVTKDAVYDVTDYVVSAAQMAASGRDASKPVEGEIAERVSIRPSGSDATVRLGGTKTGRAFVGTRIDVRTDDTVTLTNSLHARPAVVVMTVDPRTGTARSSYVVDNGGRRERHVVTVRRNG